MNQLQSTDYTTLLNDIKERVRSSQYEALKAVNKVLITLYWDIGHLIVERQASAQWGKSVVEQLAQDLQAEFPGVSGFSASNLWRMRQFYQTYKDSEKLAPMVREIGWSHNVVIFEQCKTVVEYALRESATDWRCHLPHCFGLARGFAGAVTFA